MIHSIAAFIAQNLIFLITLLENTWIIHGDIILNRSNDSKISIKTSTPQQYERMPYTHFKMETNSILKMITPHCYMAKIDIKDAYHSIPILEEHQKYLKFLFGGKLYEFTCLLDLALENLQNC